MNRLLLALATLLSLAGCQAISDKEAQLEFERLRQRTLTPQGDRILPNFGDDPSSEEVYRWSRDARPSAREVADL